LSSRNHRKEANHGRSHQHFPISHTGAAFGVSTVVTDAAAVAYA
jgi:hypothetical protein